MGPNVQIVMLDGGQDGMEQIAASLAGRTGIDAIHLISHGAEGQLSLGTGTLTQESMTGQYADELAAIRQSLSESADILVYGCDFAEGQAGQDATTLLSQLTGADVAASTDDTGHAGLGGDWDLELQAGLSKPKSPSITTHRPIKAAELTASGSPGHQCRRPASKPQLLDNAYAGSVADGETMCPCGKRGQCLGSDTADGTVRQWFVTVECGKRTFGQRCDELQRGVRGHVGTEPGHRRL